MFLLSPLQVLLALVHATLTLADIVAVKHDVAAIESAVADLSQKLHAKSLGYPAALAVHKAALSLDQKLQKGTQTVRDTVIAIPKDADADDKANTARKADSSPAQKFNLEDSRVLLDALTLLEPHVEKISRRLIELFPKMDTLGVAKLARGDIELVQRATRDLGRALVDKATGELVGEAEKLAGSFDRHLDGAMKVYRSTGGHEEL